MINSKDELVRKNANLRKLNAEYEIQMKDYRETIKRQDMLIERLRKKLNDK